MSRTCEVDGCEREQNAKGLCRKHYQRLWSGGDPHTPSQKELSVEERFWASLAPQDPVTGCIECGTGGHGQIRRDGTKIGTHCLAYELKHGPIPPGMKVCHTCDNPPCCNPDHLFLGTDADNAADRDAKGRQAKGASHGRAKLAEADVVEIRRRLTAGESQSSIAKVFGVSQATVGKIKTGKHWSHLK